MSPDSKRIIWVRLEDQEQPFKFVVKTSEVSSLDSLACLLCQNSRPQQLGIAAEDIKFLGNYIEGKESESEGKGKNNESEPLPLGVLLKDLKATDTSPLVVRYPLSNTQIVIHCNRSTSWLRQRFPHSTGLWHLLRNAAEKNFGALQKADARYFFVSKYNGEHIKNAYQLNSLVAESLARNEHQRGKLEISLSVRMEGETSEISVPSNWPLYMAPIVILGVLYSWYSLKSEMSVPSYWPLYMALIVILGVWYSLHRDESLQQQEWKLRQQQQQQYEGRRRRQ